MHFLLPLCHSSVGINTILFALAASDLPIDSKTPLTITCTTTEHKLLHCLQALSFITCQAVLFLLYPGPPSVLFEYKVITCI